MLSKEEVKKATKELIKTREEFYSFLDANIPQNSFGIYDFNKAEKLDAKRVYELFYKLDYQARKLRGMLISTYGIDPD